MTSEVNSATIEITMERLCKELSAFRVNLSDFEIGKLIGNGGFSDVYIGMQTSTGKLCAIKISKSDKLTRNAESSLQSLSIVVSLIVRYFTSLVIFDDVIDYANSHLFISSVPDLRG